ncbi:MAG: glycosyltransferase family 2 protein [Bacteroidia bacterium]
MKISVITVVFNSVNTIEQTIQSVLAQSYKNIEYIIIDAKSTDGTLKIIEKYKEKISIIISENDNGYYDGLNKGILLATGEIIGTLNADDRFASNNIIEKIVQEFTNNSGLESVIGDIAFANNSNKISRYYSSKNFKPSQFKWGIMPPHPSFYCKKVVFNKLGLYNPNFKLAGDFELLLRYLWKNKITFKYVPLLMVYMQKGGKSTGSIFTNLLVNNPEVINACKMNGLNTNMLKISMKYLLKINQFWGVNKHA